MSLPASAAIAPASLPALEVAALNGAPQWLSADAAEPTSTPQWGDRVSCECAGGAEDNASDTPQVRETDSFYTIAAGTIGQPQPAGAPLRCEVRGEKCELAASYARVSELQIKEAHSRLRSLRTFAALLQAGRSPSAAMKLVGLSGAKRSRLEKILRKAGLPYPGAEAPPHLIAAYIKALTPGISTGAPPKYPLTEQESLILRGLTLARSTQDALHFAIAVEEFAYHPGCRPETRALILAELDRAARLRRTPQWPVAIRRCGYPTMQEAAAFRGRKHSQELEQTDRRGCYWIDVTGERRPLEPHTIWEMDDASDNQPRQSIDPDTGEPILTRQALWTQDVYSAALLGLFQVARPRDSYRIEDTADHVLRCVEAWGLPQFMRLEMGKIWDGTFFHGFVPQVPGWPAEESWGGLAPLCRVVNVFKSKGKGGIEGAFNLIQALADHRSLTIGRSRGEFEDATTALVRSHRTGEIDERFWTMDTSTDAMAAVAERFNLRPKIRRMFGRDAVAPIDLLHTCPALTSHLSPHSSTLARGLPLIPSERWRFCPVKRLGTVRGGHVEFRVEHYPANFRFRINGVDPELHLDHGYQVLAAFHPGRPEEGCHLFNAELSVRNRNGFKRAERILLAPYAEDAPQIDLSSRSDFTPRKKAAAAVRRNFRAIGQALRADYAQSSDGRHLTIERTNGQTTVKTSEDPILAPRASRLAPVAARSREEATEQASIARRLLALQTDD